MEKYVFPQCLGKEHLRTAFTAAPIFPAVQLALRLWREGLPVWWIMPMLAPPIVLAVIVFNNSERLFKASIRNPRVPAMLFASVVAFCLGVGLLIYIIPPAEAGEGWRFASKTLEMLLGSAAATLLGPWFLEQCATSARKAEAVPLSPQLTCASSTGISSTAS